MGRAPENHHAAPLATAERVAVWTLVTLVVVLVVLSLVAAAMGVLWRP
jgi:hypothetical protein